MSCDTRDRGWRGKSSGIYLLGDKIEPSNFGDDRQCFRIFPGVVNERGIPGNMVSEEQTKECGSRV